MPEKNWDRLSREIVTLFTTITDEEPIYIICLNWNLVCKGFLNDKGWTKWTNDGTNLSMAVEDRSISVLIYSKLGLHEMTYHINKKPEIEHLYNAKELPKFKIIKGRHNKIDLQIQREKNMLLGKMKYFETHSLKFEPEQWDYLGLRRKIIVGRKLVKKFSEIEKDTRQVKVKSPEPKDRKAVHKKVVIHSKPKKPLKEPMEIIVNDYEESINSARSDIKALKSRDNRKVANKALGRMEDAYVIIRRCDKDVAGRNERIKKLRRQHIQLKSKPMRKLSKQTQLNELVRKIEMIDRMNEKELMIKTQKVTEFCSLREAILTIRTNEEKLKPHDVNQLIDDAVISELQSEAILKAQKKLDKYKND